MPAARKKAIYDICKRHDIIIVEDDPYYFLQLPAYKPPSESSRSDKSSLEKMDISSLEPSFLRYDEDGRVIRLESFSKVRDDLLHVRIWCYIEFFGSSRPSRQEVVLVTLSATHFLLSVYSARRRLCLKRQAVGVRYVDIFSYL